MKIKLNFKRGSTALIQNLAEHSHYISEHLKYIKHDIVAIQFTDSDEVSCLVSRESKENVDYYGIESNFFDTISILEWLVVFSQVGQLLAYQFDAINRRDSDTLWMKWVKAEMSERCYYHNPIPTFGKITKSKLLNMGNEKWRIFEMVGSAFHDQIHFKGKLAHKLPKNKVGGDHR